MTDLLQKMIKFKLEDDNQEEKEKTEADEFVEEDFDVAVDEKKKEEYRNRMQAEKYMKETEQLKRFYGQPDVTKPMKDLMSIVFSGQASSAASERVFSTASYIDTARRSRLGDDKLEMLIVIRCYLQKLTTLQEYTDFLKELRHYSTNQSKLYE